MEWYPSQNNFNGGEVSARMLDRIDTDLFKQVCLRMENFMPRMQGPAIRAPGSVYIEPLGATGNGRIIPYHTIDNRRALIVLTDGSIRFLTGVDEGQLEGSYAETTAVNRLPVQVVNNPEFNSSGATPEKGWTLSPAYYIGGQGYEGGCWYIRRDYGGVLRLSCRDWKFPKQDKDFCQVTQEVELPYASNTIKFDYRFVYADDPGVEGTDYTFTVKVGTTPGGDDVWSLDLSNRALGVYEDVVTVALPSYTPGDSIYITIDLTADEFASTPGWELDRLNGFIDGPPLPDEPPIDPDPAVEYYTSEDLPDVQFIQSPYGNKPLVLVHPQYPPQEVLYDPTAGQYVFRPIAFVNPPDVWLPGNYPSACTAYQGRLMLAGTPDETETIWGSRPGLWEDFTQFENSPTGWPTGAFPIYTPDSAVEFASTFRSPIRWMYGQNDLLIGTDTVEYAVFAEQGLLAPGNIDVRQVDAHGTIAVQPAPVGRNVAFAAERGRRVRVSRLNLDNEGWISPDATVLADHIVSSGIKRMVRMRNPHQMVVCLLDNGDLAIYHVDEMAGVNGWSRYNPAGDIKEIAVSPDSEGVDVLYMLVSRTIEGVKTQSIEAIYNWVYDRSWQYLSAAVTRNYDTPTSVIVDLEHLEGNSVYVISSNNLLGTFQVSGGQLTLEDDAGNPIEVTSARIGLANRAVLDLLPPVVDELQSGGLSASKRYVKLSVRTIGSTRPIINGVRPPDRLPLTPMNTSGSFTFVEDVSVANLGNDPLQIVRVEEIVPFAVEVTSITGKLTSNNI